MKIDDGQYVGTENEIKIFKLLCEGNTQAKTAKILGFSRPYINQVTKVLRSFDLVREIKQKGGPTFRYEYNKDISEIALDFHPPKKKVKLGKEKCLDCGKRLPVDRHRKRTFCNRKCSGHYHSGPNSSQWKGGRTFQPYCWKFNGPLKLRVRSFFNYTCFACGEPENGVTLHVHHIHYNKQACCDGGGEALLIPLCESCHNRTNRDTNGFWEKLFYTQLMARTSGKCYYSKKEWRAMKGDPPLQHLLKINEDLLGE